MSQHIATVALKYGPASFYVEQDDNGNWQAVRKYQLIHHPTLSSKTLTNHGKLYKTKGHAIRAAKAMAETQQR